MLKEDIKNLTSTQNELKYIIKKKDTDLDLHNKKLTTNNAQIIELKDQNKQINFELESSLNQMSKLTNINNDLKENFNQLKIKISDDQNKLNQLENDKSDLNLKLKGYQNQNNILENENRNFKQKNEELKFEINKIQGRIEYFEKVNGELNSKLEKNINQNNLYKQSNDELNLKLDELNELKQYKFKYFEYKQKNSDLENMLAKIKVDEDKNLQISNVVNELEDKIKFYQEENIRIGTELLETKKKSEIFKDEIEKYENQRSNLISQINTVNEVINDSKVLTNVFENKIEPKVNIIDPQNIKKQSEPDVNEKVKAIFAKKK